jgi:hypothetical protein
MPRPRPQFKDFVHYLKGAKYAPFNENDFIINTLIKINCENNHSYIVSIGQIKAGKQDPLYCPHCHVEEKRSDWLVDNGLERELFVKIAEKSNFELITKGDFFKRGDQLIEFKCKKCDAIKSFGTPKYVLTLDEIDCGSKCELRTKTADILKSEKQLIIRTNDVELKPVINSDLMTADRRCLYDSQDWHVIEYNGSRKKGTFQCKRCGDIKFAYPCNIVSKYKDKRILGNNGCKKCINDKNKIGVELKIKQECEKNEIAILFEEYKQITEKLPFGCKKCGSEFSYSWEEINRRYNKITCPFCHKTNMRGEQTEVYSYIKENYNGTIIYEERNLIKPLQLDIYLPEIKVAIEYCGTIWHSSKYINDNNYHRNKLIECESKGVRLITIFSDEWKESKEIVKSRINNILGNCKAIYARSCEVKQIDNKEALDFCDKYHIQGKGQSYIAYGLLYNNEIVSVMTFSKPMISKSATDYDYELNRFCSKINVTGGASKMFKAFIRTQNNKKIVSFCDLRWGTGNVYEKLGMKLLHTTKPNYYYVGNITNWNRKHRFGFTKKTLKERYECNLEGTEKEMAESIGLFQIYDCGHKKYIFEV